MSDAADRLARTRLAIIAHLQRREQQRGRGEQAEETESFDEHASADEHGGRRSHRSTRGSRPGAGWFGQARRVAASWWQHHPAHTALELASPALSSYAARKPFQYLGIAALAGAVVALTRPWRLVSMTGLLVAVLKSSQLSSVVMSAMAGADDGSDEGPPV